MFVPIHNHRQHVDSQSPTGCHTVTTLFTFCHHSQQICKCNVPEIRDKLKIKIKSTLLMDSEDVPHVSLSEDRYYIEQCDKHE